MALTTGERPVAGTPDAEEADRLIWAKLAGLARSGRRSSFTGRPAVRPRELREGDVLEGLMSTGTWFKLPYRSVVREVVPPAPSAADRHTRVETRSYSGGRTLWLGPQFWCTLNDGLPPGHACSTPT